MVCLLTLEIVETRSRLPGSLNRVSPSQEDRTGLPVLTQPRDTLREGLSTLKEAGAVVHPVEAIQAKVSVHALMVA